MFRDRVWGGGCAQKRASLSILGCTQPACVRTGAAVLDFCHCARHRVHCVDVGGKESVHQQRFAGYKRLQHLGANIDEPNGERRVNTPRPWHPGHPIYDIRDTHTPTPPTTRWFQRTRVADASEEGGASTQVSTAGRRTIAASLPDSSAKHLAIASATESDGRGRVLMFQSILREGRP